MIIVSYNKQRAETTTCSRLIVAISLYVYPDPIMNHRNMIVTTSLPLLFDNVNVNHDTVTTTMTNATKIM